MNSFEEKRYERLKKRMAKDNYDVTVALSTANTIYFTGTYITTQVDDPERLLITVLPAEGEPTVIGCIIEKTIIDSETWIQDRRYYTQFKQNPILMLADVLEEKGLVGGKIGIELNYLTADYYMDLVKRLPKSNFCDCSVIFSEVKMIRDSREIEYLTEAARLTNAAFNQALTEMHPGCTEREFASKVKVHMIENGANSIAFFAAGYGDNTLLNHHVPDDTVLESGDIFRLDFGCKYKWQYNSDLGRTVMIGTPNPKYLDIYQRYSEAYAQIVEGMKVGITGKEFHNHCVQVMKKMGIPFTAGAVAHSIGVAIKELPILGAAYDYTLEENMVFCLEPWAIVDGRQYHHEELILVTNNGPKILSNDKTKPELYCIK